MCHHTHKALKFVTVVFILVAQLTLERHRKEKENWPQATRYARGNGGLKELVPKAGSAIVASPGESTLDLSSFSLSMSVVDCGNMSVCIHIFLN